MFAHRWIKITHRLLLMSCNRSLQMSLYERPGPRNQDSAELPAFAQSLTLDGR
jgi:hypothetical protein